MALERGIPDFLIWLLGDPRHTSLLVPTTWGFLFGTLAICLLLFFVVPFICFLVLSLQYGPSEAFYYVARSIFTAVTEDLPKFSPRRTFALPAWRCKKPFAIRFWSDLESFYCCC